jgi:hypothetical protein
MFNDKQQVLLLLSGRSDTVLNLINRKYFDVEDNMKRQDDEKNCLTPSDPTSNLV